MNKTLDISEASRPTPILSSDLKNSLWSTRIKIRFGHCDPAGIVYTPKFFDIFNVAIEKWYEDALGIDYYEIIGARRIGLGYANAHADFFSPCTMGSPLDIVVDLERIGNSSFVILLHAFQGEIEALRGRFTVVTTDLTNHKPAPIPEDLRGALLVYSSSMK
jgi:4-hydroxybenzoyl-CoA thioesterase/acyl-CoA thioester hydrolase